jgi:hypothetical protein
VDELSRFAGRAPLALALALSGAVTGAPTTRVSMALHFDASSEDAPALDPALLDVAPGDASEWEEEAAAPEGTQAGPEIAVGPERGAGRAA